MINELKVRSMGRKLQFRLVFYAISHWQEYTIDSLAEKEAELERERQRLEAIRLAEMEKAEREAAEAAAAKAAAEAEAERKFGIKMKFRGLVAKEIADSKKAALEARRLHIRKLFRVAYRVHVVGKRIRDRFLPYCRIYRYGR